LEAPRSANFASTEFYVDEKADPQIRSTLRGSAIARRAL